MSNPPFDARRLLNTARTRKRYWIPLVLIVVFAVNVSAPFLPERYEANATVKILEPPSLKMIADQATDLLDVRDRLETILEEVTSFSFVEKVAAKPTLNLTGHLDPRTREYERVIKSMQKRINLYTKNDDLFVLSYRGPTAHETYHVADEILNLFFENTANFYESRTEKTKEVIAKKVKDAVAHRDEIQDLIKQYKEAHPNEIPEVQVSKRAQLDKFYESLAENEEAFKATQDMVALAERKLADTPTEIVSETTREQNREIIEYKAEIRELELERDLLLKDFLEEHPKVVKLNHSIILLADKIKLLEENQIEKVTTAPNPRYQLLEEEILRGEMGIKRAERSIAEKKRQIEKLEKYMVMIPTREDDLQKLQSQLAMADESVQDLTSKLNEAGLAATIEQEGQGPTFVPLDRPRMPTQPVFPNPIKFAAASLVLGFGAGALLVYLLTLLDTALRTMEEARQALRMPILGIVQNVEQGDDAGRKRRHRRTALGEGNVALSLTLFAATLATTASMGPNQPSRDPASETRPTTPWKMV